VPPRLSGSESCRAEPARTPPVTEAMGDHDAVGIHPNPSSEARLQGKQGTRIMKGKLISEGAQRTFAVVLNTGDETVQCLTAFAKKHRLSASHFTAIGAFRDCVLGHFDWQRKDYMRIPIDEQVEVLALVGDVALNDGEPTLHPHVVVGKADGTAHGGHLLEAHVRPTLEVIITESPSHLQRRSDPETGLALIRL
jgi:hypothetical protein